MRRSLESRSIDDSHRSRTSHTDPSARSEAWGEHENGTKDEFLIRYRRTRARLRSFACSSWMLVLLLLLLSGAGSNGQQEQTTPGCILRFGLRQDARREAKGIASNDAHRMIAGADVLVGVDDSFCVRDPLETGSEIELREFDKMIVLETRCWYSNDQLYLHLAGTVMMLMCMIK